jgi:AcrR family transcriptional regulator
MSSQADVVQSPAQSAGASLAAARRAQIIEAATAVFAEKGYQRATVKEIAARAGLAPGTIYLYFASKRDVLLALADHLIAQAIDKIAAQAAQLSAEGYIRVIMQDRVRFVRENAALIRAVAAELWTDEELLRRFWQQLVPRFFFIAAGHMRVQIAAGKLRPAKVEVVLPAVIGGVLLLGLLKEALPGNLLDDVSEDALIDELTTLYLHGLSPAASPRANQAESEV